MSRHLIHLPDTSTCRKTLIAVLQSARPAHIVKSALMVLWGEFAAGSIARASFRSTLAVIAGAALWGGLYGLNDLFDAHLDKQSRHKRFRPLPRGSLSKINLQRAVAAELLAGFLCCCFLSAPASLFALIAVANHLTYNLAPFRLKDRAFFDILSAGVISQSCKLGIGIYSSPSHHAPHIADAVAFAVVWKCGFYLLYRVASEPPAGFRRLGTPGLLGTKHSLFMAVALIAASLLILVYFLHLRGTSSVSILSAAIIVAGSACAAIYFAYNRKVQASPLGYLVFGAREPSAENTALPR